MLDIHRVVVLGAGFAGVRVAHELDKAKLPNLSITLIDRSPYHLYTPNLYELAAALEDNKKKTLLDTTTKLPLKQIFAGTKVRTMEGEIGAIDTKEKTVFLEDKRKITYDSLVIALGSIANHFGIAGLNEHAITLKSAHDAERIRTATKRLLDGKKQPVRIVIGGGGPTGVELAAALADSTEKHPTGTAEITLVEAGETVLKPFGEKAQQYTQQTLVKKGIELILGTRITSADKDKVTFHNKKTKYYDLLIWTGGIQAPQILETLPVTLERGRLMTGERLTCVPTSGTGNLTSDIYALGDASCFKDGERIAAWTAHAAMEQGYIVAHNIKAKITGKQPKTYHVNEAPFVIPLGKRHGVAKVAGKVVTGPLVLILKKFVELRYLLATVTLWTALRLWLGRVKG